MSHASSMFLFAPLVLSLGIQDHVAGLVWVMDGGRGMRHLAASAGAALVDALALADVDCGLVVDGCVAHALLDLASHGQECLLDIGGVLGRGFEEGNADRVGKLL